MHSSNGLMTFACLLVLYLSLASAEDTSVKFTKYIHFASLHLILSPKCQKSTIGELLIDSYTLVQITPITSAHLLLINQWEVNNDVNSFHFFYLNS